MSITNKYVLVIDDDSTLRKVLTVMLKKHPNLRGWNVFQAANGDEGLEIFTNYRPALVLVDKDMPGKTGLEVTEIIKSSVPETKIIGMSGCPDNRHNFKTAGADNFIEKPISLYDLWDAVNKILDLYRQE